MYSQKATSVAVIALLLAHASGQSCDSYNPWTWNVVAQTGLVSDFIGDGPTFITGGDTVMSRTDINYNNLRYPGHTVGLAVNGQVQYDNGKVKAGMDALGANVHMSGVHVYGPVNVESTAADIVLYNTFFPDTLTANDQATITLNGTVIGTTNLVSSGPTLSFGPNHFTYFVNLANALWNLANTGSYTVIGGGVIEIGLGGGLAAGNSQYDNLISSNLGVAAAMGEVHVVAMNISDIRNAFLIRVNNINLDTTRRTLIINVNVDVTEDASSSDTDGPNKTLPPLMWEFTMGDDLTVGARHSRTIMNFNTHNDYIGVTGGAHVTILAPYASVMSGKANVRGGIYANTLDFSGLTSQSHQADLCVAQTEPIPPVIPSPPPANCPLGARAAPANSDSSSYSDSSSEDVWWHTDGLGVFVECSHKGSCVGNNITGFSCNCDPGFCGAACDVSGDACLSEAQCRVVIGANTGCTPGVSDNCPWTVVPDGTWCDDGDANTHRDICTNGICAGKTSLSGPQSSEPFCVPCNKSYDETCYETATPEWCAWNCIQGTYYGGACNQQHCYCNGGYLPECFAPPPAPIASSSSQSEEPAGPPCTNCNHFYSGECPPSECACIAGWPSILLTIQLKYQILNPSMTIKAILAELCLTNGWACELDALLPPQPVNTTGNTTHHTRQASTLEDEEPSWTARLRIEDHDYEGNGTMDALAGQVRQQSEKLDTERYGILPGSASLTRNDLTIIPIVIMPGNGGGNNGNNNNNGGSNNNNNNNGNNGNNNNNNGGNGNHGNGGGNGGSDGTGNVWVPTTNGNNGNGGNNIGNTNNQTQETESKVNIVLVIGILVGLVVVITIIVLSINLYRLTKASHQARRQHHPDFEYGLPVPTSHQDRSRPGDVENGLPMQMAPPASPLK